MNVLNMDEKENLEYIGNGINVVVSSDYKFNMDTVLLANFSSNKYSQNAIDLGTGCGAIPLIWIKSEKFDKITAVDIQSNAIELLKKSISLNKLNGKITPICNDIKILHNVLKQNSFDVVCCNPPYKQLGTGFVSSSKCDSLARHETACTIFDIIKLSSKLLKFSGRLYICNRPQRLCTVIEIMKNFKIEPKELRFVSQRYGKPPKLFLMEGRLGAKEGLKILPELIIEDINGNISKEINVIYGNYRDEVK